MMRATVHLLLFILLAAGIAWLADQSGRVSIDWLGYRIDTYVGVLVAASVVVGVLAALVYRLWRFLAGAPGAIARRRREGRRLKGYRALTQGMVAVAAGDAEEARRQARRADLLLNEPPLTMLLSAQAAQLNGDEAAAERYFTAMLERPETAFLGLRGLIVQATRKGEVARALELARRARALRPRTGWVLTTLHDLQARAGDWAAAAETARLAVRANAMAPKDGERNRAIARYEQGIRAEAAGERDAALEHARKAVKLDPAFVPAAVLAARLLAAAGRRRRARHVLEAAWAASPHPELARAYLALDHEVEPLARLMRLQKLIGLRPDDAESRLALAEAALAARLWGEARRALEALGAGDGAALPARACRLWAELEEAERGDGAAARAWLKQAAGVPDPAWICDHCGAAHTTWAPLCQRCGAYDSMVWRTPARAAPAELAAPEAAAAPPAALPPTAPPPAEAATDVESMS